LKSSTVGGVSATAWRRRRGLHRPAQTRANASALSATSPQRPGAPCPSRISGYGEMPEARGATEDLGEMPEARGATEDRSRVLPNTMYVPIA
jgi:hypothetical protein